MIDDEPVIQDDVYVVRTDASGARVWEYRYDIRGTHVNDTGYGIRQVDGQEKFIITGGTQLGEGGSDMFLLEIDCNGAVNWSKVFRNGVSTLVIPRQERGMSL